MRVTFNMINTNVQRNISQNFSRLSKLEEEISTGVRLNRPSDGPLDITNALKARSELAANGQFMRNVDDGLAYLRATDSSFGNIIDLLQRVRELMVQANNDTNTQQERTFISQELEQLTRQLSQFANTKFKGNFLFGGTEINIAPYSVGQKSTGFQFNDTEPLGDGDNVFNANEWIQLYTTDQDGNISAQTFKNIVPGTVSITDGNSGAVLQEWDAEDNPNGDFIVDYERGRVLIISDPLSASLPLTNGSHTVTFENIQKALDPLTGLEMNNDVPVLREINTNVALEINTPGDRVFEKINGRGLFDDLVAMISNLRQKNVIDVAYNANQLANPAVTAPDNSTPPLGWVAPEYENSRTGISNAIGRMDDILKSVLNFAGQNGSRLNRFEITLSQLKEEKINITEFQSKLEDVDMAEAIMNFNIQSNLYNAALNSGARIIQPSLADFLR